VKNILGSELIDYFINCIKHEESENVDHLHQSQIVSSSLQLLFALVCAYEESQLQSDPTIFLNTLRYYFQLHTIAAHVQHVPTATLYLQ